MQEIKTSIILHGSPEPHFANTMRSILAQADKKTEIIIINPENADIVSYLKELQEKGASCSASEVRRETKGGLLNAAFKAAQGTHILYLDNENIEIQLKQGILEIFFLQMEYYPKAGMLYGDYELVESDQIKEVKLLKTTTAACVIIRIWAGFLCTVKRRWKKSVMQTKI